MCAVEVVEGRRWNGKEDGRGLDVRYLYKSEYLRRGGRDNRVE